MTHKHFVPGVLLAAVTITAIQVSGGFTDQNTTVQPSIVQAVDTQNTSPTS